MVALLIVALLAADGGEREQYGVAIRLNATGEHSRAASMLVELAETTPGHALADDALLKAAQIYEEHLADPARAVELYERFLEQYPDVRAARRAEIRIEVLRRGLGDGRWADVLGRYQAIRTRYSQGDRAGAIRAMVELVDHNPEFPLAGEGRLWIADGYRIDGWIDEAATWYRRAREGADPELGWRASKSLADLTLSRGEIDEAEALYRSLDTNTAVREQVVEAALANVDVVRQRARWSAAGWVAIALFLIGMLVVIARATHGARGALRAIARPPTELIYLVPVALIWAAVAATSNTLVARATVFILIGGVAVTWLSGAAITAARDRGPVGVAQRIGHAALAAAAIVGICYIALANERLLELIGETVKFGHDGH